jgi:hypothetical protein
MYRSGLIAASALLALGVACKAEAPSTAAQAQAIAPQGDQIWAASGVVRVVDSGRQRVIGQVPVGHPITSMVFAPDGSTAYVGTSAGLYVVEVGTRAVRGPLTAEPIRRLELQGNLLFILQHQVIVGPDGTRDIQPFRLVHFDRTTEKVVDDQEIGQRIHYASDQDGRHLVVSEAGQVRIGASPENLSAGRALDLPSLVPGRGPYRVRGDVTVREGSRALVAIEGKPAHLLVLDLEAGSARAIDLGRETGIRGLAFLPDGRRAVVNAMSHLLVVELASGKITGQLELPGPHVGASLSADGQSLYLAQTVEGTGGAVTQVHLSPLAVGIHVHLEDISPWALAVLPGANPRQP